MQQIELIKELSNTGISRRTLLKLLGAGAAYSALPSMADAKSVKKSSKSQKPSIIFVVGDGMPLGVVRAMHEVSVRAFGRERTNFYTRFKDSGTAVGFMGTKSLSSIVTDSAPASVAWSTGSRTSNRMLASLPDGRPLKTIMELAKENGYACGLVTTARITHATPAAWYSTQKNRDDEDAIALDLLKFNPEVALGGGSDFFIPAKRKDQKDVFSEFITAGYDVVKDRNTLLSDSLLSSTKPLIGVFNRSHLSFSTDRRYNEEIAKNEPTLSEMTATALNKLSKQRKGFVLQVEAGRIDHANHYNDAWSAILETCEMDATLGVIDEYLKTNPYTLVIVTSDHGNSGWGINGTGFEYNEATEALMRYLPVRASFEVLVKKIKEKTAAEIKDIFEQYTTYVIQDAEAAMLYESLQKGYKAFPRDFVYPTHAAMGKILAQSIAGENGDHKSILRRGNVGFTSCNHTGEDQLVIAYGYKAGKTGINRHIENIDLFRVMCSFLGLNYINPSMTEEEAKHFIKVASMDEWNNHLKMHVA